MRDFRKLKIWERGYRLTLDVYGVTAAFPREEVYGLTRQMRRSCAAIPANIAEGCGRGSKADLARFLQIALGSATELENHLLLAGDLLLLQPDDYKRLAGETTELKRMLTAFVKNLKTFADKP
ncbi:MAG: hypothetical protein AVDCRST_MAG22-3621 [uncultured Rubrobacteraceae bacterium]|uniref:Four helix bundle protein n=1 Tax=uncultured Rubrobacteraceae bacterium TaxID=349277 RepID=A0A6J4Q9B5_9ACTN|nr:MAG: hypothetical protein AVDCRST_MAG22-3621 [uncultured Rubrobacteraceae bacterium]